MVALVQVHPPCIDTSLVDQSCCSGLQHGAHTHACNPFFCQRFINHRSHCIHVSGFSLPCVVGMVLVDAVLHHEIFKAPPEASVLHVNSYLLLVVVEAPGANAVPVIEDEFIRENFPLCAQLLSILQTQTACWIPLPFTPVAKRPNPTVLLPYPALPFL